MNRTRVALVVLVVVLVALCVLAPTALAKRNLNPRVLPPHSTAFGMTYSDWSAKWWQWILAIPQDKNPAFDFTGANAAQGQSGKVWFLAGTMEPDWTGAMNAERTCTVPLGKAIFLPIINAEMSPPEGPTMTWPELVAFASSFIDDVTVAELTVDGRAINVTGAYRVQTTTDEAEAPSYTMPEGGVFTGYGIAPGTYKFFSDGYWVMLAPLRAGKHELVLHGVAQGDWGLFETQVIYHLTVRGH